MVAHVFSVVVGACGGETVAIHDAGPPCAETAHVHDEDGDGVLDACDNCPSIANPTQSDAIEIDAHAFADGVGDACDPRPRAGGDVLREFFSFETDAQASAWTGTGFSISDDAAHASGAASWATTRTTTAGGVHVLAQLSSVTFGTSGELAITVDGDAGVGATCTLSAQQLAAQDVGDTPVTTELSAPIEPMQPVTLVAWRALVVTPMGYSTTLLCRVSTGGTLQQATVPIAGDIVSGAQAIVVRDASVDITSVSVYTSPLPKNP